MENVQNPRGERSVALPYKSNKELLRLLVVQIQPELFFHLFYYFIGSQYGVKAQVGNGPLLTKVQKVDDEACAPPQKIIRLAAQPLELPKAFLASKPVDHGLGKPERRREGLGVSPKYEAKVNVKEVAGGTQHDVVQVPIADAQYVRDDAVSGARADVSVKDGRLAFVRRRVTGVVSSEESQYAVWVGSQNG